MASEMLGGECTVVLMGRMFRCIMRGADMRAHQGGEMMQSMGGESTFVPGLMRRTLHVDYVVLEELALDAQQSQAVQATLVKVAQEARDRGERQIDVE